jgi:hypothetical protein
MRHRVILNPDAILRGETIDAVMERITGKVKPPLTSKARGAAELVAEPA